MTYSERELEFTFAKNDLTRLCAKTTHFQLKTTSEMKLPVKSAFLQRRFQRTWTHVHVRYMSSSVRPSVCLSVTSVRPTQAIEIFGHIFTPFGTLAIYDLSVNIFKISCGIYASLLYFLVRVQCRHKESSRSLSHLLMSFLQLSLLSYN